MSAPHLPEPPVPPECDLRDFGYLPLYVVRFRDSGLASIENAEAFRAAVLGLCAAWHQLPASSLPDDDAELCRLLGYGRDVKGWKRLRAEGALRGWVRCSDGRLYHPVLAAEARNSWQKKAEARERTAAARAARQAKRGSPETTEPKHEAPSPFLSQSGPPPATERVTEDVTGSKGRESKGKGEIRESEGKGELFPPAPRKRGGERATAEPEGFEAWWREYPRKVGKDGARRAYSAAVKRGATEAALLMALRRQRWPEEERFIPHPSTWLNGGRWQDDPEAAAPPKRGAQDWVWDELARQGGTPPDTPDASWPPTIDGAAHEIDGEPPS